MNALRHLIARILGPNPAPRRSHALIPACELDHRTHTHDWIVTCPPGYGTVISPCDGGLSPGFPIDTTPQARLEARRQLRRHVTLQRTEGT